MNPNVAGSIPAPCAKLFILVRADLEPGLQLAQTAHAAMQFAVDHPAAFAAWFRESNNVAILQVADEVELRAWVSRGVALRCALFTEPDLDDQATAAAFLPGAGAPQRAFRRLKLAGCTESAHRT